MSVCSIHYLYMQGKKSMAIVKVHFDPVKAHENARALFEEEFTNPELSRIVRVSRVPCVGERFIIAASTWQVTDVRHRSYFVVDREKNNQIEYFDANIFLTLVPELSWQ